jgi:hypothetical protein
MKQLRWHADPNCPLGVSGRAKLLEEYDDNDRNHRPDLQAMLDEIKELALTRNYHLSREDIVKMYERLVR